MKQLIVCLAACLAPSPSQAQELSLARYVGALEGAVQACVEAYPANAAVYRDTLRRSVQCGQTDAQFRLSLEEMRTRSPGREEYAQGYAAGRKSLSKHPAESAKQCESLAALVCHSKQ
jgi:hypothetical protein